MKIFLSSTVYDLIDIRAEISALLSNLKCMPCLSDDKLSSFNELPSQNSIETCLINLRASDLVIFVLNQRYGPCLGAHFGNISATHLEYREAIKDNKSILFFVRDRLYADYHSYKKNGRKYDISYPWVNNEKDLKLFEFIEEHSELSETPRNNWVIPFTNSIDLKNAISKHVEVKIRPERLIQAIDSNYFPAFTAEMEVTQLMSPLNLKIKVIFKNRGLSPAFDFSIKNSSSSVGRENRKKIVYSGEQVFNTFLLDINCNDVDVVLELEYLSSIGVVVLEKYRVIYQNHGMGVGQTYKVDLEDRIYTNSNPPILEIADAKL